MSAPVKGCPQREDTPERVRAYTPEQSAAMRQPVDVLDGLDALARNIRARANRPYGPPMPVRDAETVEAMRDAMSELIDAVDDLTANLFSITKTGIRTPLSTRQAATRAHAALARVGGVK